ncbi:MAG: carboxylate-amine ligase [Microcoleus sp. SIO2G3]|nr:carboxylate-amine ligase [Microcoleus sp. SIO2G3]
MSPQAEEFTLGVEEEYQIINPQTRQLCARSQVILPTAQSALGNEVAKPEFRQSQIEVATPICRSLQDVRAQLIRLRGEVIAAAAKEGYQIAAAGTHPFSHWQEQLVTSKLSYEKLVQNYQLLMHELVTLGCHVHVGLHDREMAVQVMNRARLWLAPMLALSASSPFWLGMDTGYASYRTVLISRLPITGAPDIFESFSDYQVVVRSLIATNTIQEATQICWDLRPSERYPTLEFRVADMCMTIDESVMMAGLARALVRTCYEQALLDTPYKAVRPELLRAAHWSASRWGVDAELVDVDAECSVPAQKLVKKFLEFVRPALEEFGEWDEVYAIVQETMQQGNSAARQRDLYKRTGSLEDVIDFIVRETAKGTMSV